ncbi:helix-turn-helix transcriptional regulator [Pectobacterium versatile]|uniref:helix-turn-helix transcriptional regulator n=1 Tax=Pectobacterium versatile TaxID=2488639 RepID=UPI001B8D56A5|nr:WYL domain-containing protein [Pectobacterium versatile]
MVITIYAILPCIGSSRQKLLEESASEQDGFDIDRYIKSGAFSSQQNEQEVELIADIQPQTAWLLCETPLSHQQSLEPLPDSDWYRLRALVPLDQETLWWIFGLNDNIRVYEPNVWVQEIKKKMERLRQMYEEQTCGE